MTPGRDHLHMQIRGTVHADRRRRNIAVMVAAALVAWVLSVGLVMVLR